MELWIRSQDKENLIKVIDIKIKEMENRTYKYGDIGKSNEFAIVSNNIILGYYETKERAFEVLDEIQNILRPRIMMKYNDDFTMSVSDIEPQPAIYVYEMPKE